MQSAATAIEGAANNEGSWRRRFGDHCEEDPPAKGLGPTIRRGPPWREFLRTQASSIIAVEFFTVPNYYERGMTGSFRRGNYRFR